MTRPAVTLITVVDLVTVEKIGRKSLCHTHDLVFAGFETASHNHAFDGGLASIVHYHFVIHLDPRLLVGVGRRVTAPTVSSLPRCLSGAAAVREQTTYLAAQARRSRPVSTHCSESGSVLQHQPRTRACRRATPAPEQPVPLVPSTAALHRHRLQSTPSGGRVVGVPDRWFGGRSDRPRCLRWGLVVAAATGCLQGLRRCTSLARPSGACNRPGQKSPLHRQHAMARATVLLVRSQDRPAATPTGETSCRCPNSLAGVPPAEVLGASADFEPGPPAVSSCAWTSWTTRRRRPPASARLPALRRPSTRCGAPRRLPLGAASRRSGSSPPLLRRPEPGNVVGGAQRRGARGLDRGQRARPGVWLAGGRVKVRSAEPLRGTLASRAHSQFNSRPRRRRAGRRRRRRRAATWCVRWAPRPRTRWSATPPGARPRRGLDGHSGPAGAQPPLDGAAGPPRARWWRSATPGPETAATVAALDGTEAELQFEAATAATAPQPSRTGPQPWWLRGARSRPCSRGGRSGGVLPAAPLATNEETRSAAGAWAVARPDAALYSGGGAWDRARPPGRPGHPGSRADAAVGARASASGRWPPMAVGGALVSEDHGSTQ